MGEKLGPKDLKAWRLKLGHSQATLGAALGLSMRQIIRYEKSKCPIPEMLWMALRTVPSRKRGK